MKKFLLSAVLFLALFARSEILVDDIRIEGLQRVSLGSVLDTVPVTIGDRIDETDYKRIIRTLFTTGQFDDEALFYLRSRGLSRASALQHLTLGFVNEIIDTIKDENHKDFILNKILAN